MRLIFLATLATFFHIELANLFKLSSIYRNALIFLAVAKYSNYFQA